MNSASTGEGSLERAYQWYSNTFCSWVAVPNKVCKTISYALPLFGLIAPLSARMSKLASIAGRVRPAFYASIMVSYAPKLWRTDENSVRGNLFGVKNTPNKRDPLKAAFYLCFLSFQALITVAGTLDLLQQLRSMQQFQRGLKLLYKIAPFPVIGTDLLAVALTARAIKRAEHSKEALCNSAVGLVDDSMDAVGTALEAQWTGSSAEIPLSLVFLSVSAVVGVADAVRNFKWTEREEPAAQSA